MSGELFYDPEFELFTLATPDVVADPRIRLDVLEHRGSIEVVQWRIMPAVGR